MLASDQCFKILRQIYEKVVRCHWCAHHIFAAPCTGTASDDCRQEDHAVAGCGPSRTYLLLSHAQQKHADAFVSCVKAMQAINKKMDRSKFSVDM